MKEISQRLKQIIEYKGLNVMRFEKAIGAGNNSIGSCIKRNSNLSGKLISKILNTYEEINPDWLINGNGNMLKNQNVQSYENDNNIISVDDSPSSYKTKQNENKALKEVIKSKDEIIKGKDEIIELLKNKICVLENEIQNFNNPWI